MKKDILIAFCFTLLWTHAAYSQKTVGETPTKAVARDGRYISWREHIIDEPASAGFALSGSDGLVMAGACSINSLRGMLMVTAIWIFSAPGATALPTTAFFGWSRFVPDGHPRFSAGAN